MLLMNRRNRLLASVAASASFAIGALLIAFLFTDLPFYFVDGKQIEVTGHFVNCAPTRSLDICYTSGFKENEANTGVISSRYYLITNLQEILESNPTLTPLIRTYNVENNQFKVTGVFSYGPPRNYEDAAVIGGIEAKSIEPVSVKGGGIGIDNASLAPPTDEISLQVLDSESLSAVSSQDYVLPIHVVHKVNPNDSKNDTLTIFPIIPMWEYYASEASQEKEFLLLQDDKGNNITSGTFLYREGVFQPIAACEPAGDFYGPRQQMEVKVASPMSIPIQKEWPISSNEHQALFARYNLYGLSPHFNKTTVKDLSIGPGNGESANPVPARYNLTFSSFNNVKIQLPDDANELSRMQWSCTIEANNPIFPSWHTNVYNVVFDVKSNAR